MRPLPALTLLFAAGVLAAWLLGGDAPRAATPAGIGAAGPGSWAVLVLGAAALLTALGRRTGPLALMAVAAGLLHGGARTAAPAADCRLAIPDGAEVRGVGRFLAASLPGEAVPFEATGLVFRGGPPECAGVLRVRLRTGDGPPVGAAVEVVGSWWRSAPPGVVLSRGERAGILTVESVAPGRGRPAPLARLRGGVQTRLRMLLPPAQAGLAESLLLARREGLPDATRERFVAAGLVHLLAISGMHVGLVMAGLLWMVRAAGAGARLRTPLAVSGAALYVLFLGAPPAAARAVLQLGLLVAARALQRPADRLALLAAAALLLLVADPLLIVDAGFQLSFLGLLGLIALTRPATALVARLRPRAVREGVAASLAASALTTPVAALHFGTFAPVGVVATVAAVPWLAAALPFLVAALAATVLLPPAAAPLGQVAGFLLQGLEGVASLAAAVPLGHGLVSATGVQAALAAAGAALVLYAGWMRPPVGRRADVGVQLLRARSVGIALAAAGGLLAASAVGAVAAGGGGDLEIHAIDVGQGDAIAIHTPDGRWILVDTGPASASWDAGRATVVPYLLARGVRRLDVLVLTHPDADHIGGAGAVLDAFSVAVVVDPGLPAGKPRFLDLLEVTDARAGRWVGGWDGRELSVGDVAFRFLHPEPPTEGGPEGNESSVVFMLHWHGFRALFTGDAGAEVERRLVADHGATLAADLLKVGHHGSLTSTGVPFLQAVSPAIALVPVGRGNRYGHPHPLVMERLRGSGARVLRTDHLGDIVLRVRRDGSIRVAAERPPR